MEVGVRPTKCSKLLGLKENTHVCTHNSILISCVKIQNMVRVDSSVIVSLLMEIIKQQYDYNVKYRRVWQAKRKALVAIFGDWENDIRSFHSG